MSAPYSLLPLLLLLTVTAMATTKTPDLLATAPKAAVDPALEVDAAEEARWLAAELATRSPEARSPETLHALPRGQLFSRVRELLVRQFQDKGRQGLSGDEAHFLACSRFLERARSASVRTYLESVGVGEARATLTSLEHLKAVKAAAVLKKALAGKADEASEDFSASQRELMDEFEALAREALEAGRLLPARSAEAPGPLLAQGLMRPSEFVAGASALFLNVGAGARGQQARRVLRIDKAGKVQVLAEGRPQITSLVAGTNGKVYWAEKGTVLSVPEAGGELKAVVQFVNALPQSLVEHGGTLYVALKQKSDSFIDDLPSPIVAVDGKGKVRLLTEKEQRARLLGVEGGRLYWTGMTGLRSMPLKGGKVTSHDVDGRAPFVVGPAHLYWAGRGESVVYRMPRAGDEPEPAFAADIASMVVAGQVLYFTELSTSSSGQVQRQVEGEEPSVIARYEGGLGTLAVLGSELYLLAADATGELAWLYRVKLPAPTPAASDNP